MKKKTKKKASTKIRAAKHGPITFNYREMRIITKALKESSAVLYAISDGSCLASVLDAAEIIGRKVLECE